jgi:CDK inhibitor PHO81
LEATTLVSVLPLVMACANSQAAVPSLVASVKDAGLLLATFGSGEDVSKLRTGTADGRTVDAFLIDG